MAVLLSGSFLFLAVVGRVIIQMRETGNHGIRFANPRTDLAAAVAGTTFLLSFASSIGLILLDFIRTWPLERWFLFQHADRMALTIGFLGIVIVITAQWQMHGAWRIGVDPEEKTALVTHGLFARSRNPIYFGIFLYWLGLAGTLPHPAIWCLAIICWVSIEIIVRRVEEPYLRSLHGAEYEAYVGRSNRYLIV